MASAIALASKEVVRKAKLFIKNISGKSLDAHSKGLSDQKEERDKWKKSQTLGFLAGEGVSSK